MKVGDSRGSNRQKATAGPALAVRFSVTLELNKLNSSSKAVSSSDFLGRNQRTCSLMLTLSLIRGLSQI